MRAPRRLLGLVAAGALGASCVLVGFAPAHAQDTNVPGELSTTAANTSRFDIPVPDGVVPEAISGVLTMPEVVNSGQVTFLVNGRVVDTVSSVLYAKIRIPVTAADVIADGTIGLSVVSQGAAIGGVCRPLTGAASFRKIVLSYSGQERPPTTLANFFPASSNRIDVLVAPDADNDLLEAGLAAVAALSSRYDEGTVIELGSTDDAPTSGVATQRVVVLQEGRAGEVTTDVSTTSGDTGVPVLTIAAAGDDLGAAAKALALTQGGDTLQLADDPNAEGISAELGKRKPDLEQSLADVGADVVSLSGYGTTSQLVTIPQDTFSTPVSVITMHLQGIHSSVTDPDRARLDVRMNGALVGSQSLDQTGDLDMDFTIPASRLRSVNELQLVLAAVTPDGLPCAAPGSPPIEVDIDTAASTLTATAGLAGVKGFQVWPQLLQSSLPVAVRTEGGQRFTAVQQLSRIVGALQHAASYPLDVQLVPADAFIADDRSGVIVGATAADATSLEAPLKLSSIRLLDQPDSSFQVTSQEPYAALEAVGPHGGVDRQVLMLGGWSPGNGAAPPGLTSKLVDFLVNNGWSKLDGDLLLTDESAPPFTVDSRTLVQEKSADPAAKEGRSYAKWFVAGVVLLLLLLAFQVVLSIRRDREVALSDQDDVEPAADQPGYLDDLESREQPVTPALTTKAPVKKAAPRTSTPPPAKEPTRSPVKRLTRTPVEPPAKKVPPRPPVKKAATKKSPYKKKR